MGATFKKDLFRIPKYSVCVRVFCRWIQHPVVCVCVFVYVCWDDAHNMVSKSKIMRLKKIMRRNQNEKKVSHTVLLFSLKS